MPVRLPRLFWILPLVLLACAAPTLRAEDDLTDRKLTLLPHWKQGQKNSYQLVMRRTRTAGGKPALDGTTRTPISIEVLSAGDSGFVLAWTQGATKFDDAGAPQNQLAEKLSSMTAGTQVELEISTAGEFQGVRNWKQLKTTAEKTVMAVLKEMKAAGTDPEAIKAVEAQMGQMLATQEQVEAMCTRESRLMLVVFNKEFDPAEPSEYEDTLPNPFGGDPFAAHGEFSLQPLTAQAKTANVTWTQTVDAESAARGMQALVAKLAAQAGKPVDDKAFPPMEIKDSTEFAVDIASGWVRKMTHARTVQMGADRQEDSFSLDLVPKKAKKPAAE